jgi:putative addiction module component (TIGR02574 family)
MWKFMTPLLEQAFMKIRQLPEHEQDAIATWILEELMPDVSEAQKAELDRRLEDYKEFPESGSSWEDVKSRLK